MSWCCLCHPVAICCPTLPLIETGIHDGMGWDMGMTPFFLPSHFYSPSPQLKLIRNTNITQYEANDMSQLHCAPLLNRINWIEGKYMTHPLLLPSFPSLLLVRPGNGLNTYNESESLLKYELMDGTCPPSLFLTSPRFFSHLLSSPSLLLIPYTHHCLTSASYDFKLN